MARRASPGGHSPLPPYKPQLARLVKSPPEGDDWLHEMKYDGYRIGCRIKPSFVGEVVFGEWTDDGKIRHPSFQGLRRDKSPAKVVREEPVTSSKNFGKAARAASSAVAPRKKTPAPKPGRVEIAGVSISHPDRLMYPESGLTKADIAQYFVEIERWAVPQKTIANAMVDHDPDLFTTTFAKAGRQRLPKPPR